MRISGAISSGLRSAGPAEMRPGSSISHYFCDAAAPTSRRRRAKVASMSRRRSLDVASCHAAAAACHAPRIKHSTLLLRRSCWGLLRSSGGLLRSSGGLPRLSGGLPRSVGGLPLRRRAPPRLRRQGSSVWCVTSSPKGKTFQFFRVHGHIGLNRAVGLF